MKTLIRKCINRDFETIYEIINEAAQAYKGVIPKDCWKENPEDATGLSVAVYMSKAELQHEIDNGVVFRGYEEAGELAGVMGIQHVKDVTLIRHAYVRTAKQNHGIGAELLSHLQTLTTRPVLIGTWADAVRAVRFYEKHGFKLVTSEEKNRLLKKYWSVSDRQIETSVVLGDEKWFEAL
ncbi:MAG: GNAT family N-acetyltransferase [Firmicutes bacterium]|nr:GNAT family N-acetyltransferase [Bacillota bacterium]